MVGNMTTNSSREPPSYFSIIKEEPAFFFSVKKDIIEDITFLVQVPSLKVRKQVRRQGTVVCRAQVGSHQLWVGSRITQQQES